MSGFFLAWLSFQCIFTEINPLETDLVGRVQIRHLCIK
jgi:hypothetical protein